TATGIGRRKRRADRKPSEKHSLEHATRSVLNSEPVPRSFLVGTDHGPGPAPWLGNFSWQGRERPPHGPGTVRGPLCVEGRSARGRTVPDNPCGYGPSCPLRFLGCRPPTRPEGRIGNREWLPPRSTPKVLCRQWADHLLLSGPTHRYLWGFVMFWVFFCVVEVAQKTPFGHEGGVRHMARVTVRLY